MNITKVKHLSAYKVEVTFADEKRTIANFEPFLTSESNPMSTQFLAIERFKNVKISNGHLTWEDGQMDIPSWAIYKGDFSV